MNTTKGNTKKTAKKAIQPVKSGDGTARKPHSANKAALAAVAPKKSKVVTMPAVEPVPVPVATPVPVTVAPKATTVPAVKKEPADRSDAAKRAWVTIRANRAAAAAQANA